MSYTVKIKRQAKRKIQSLSRIERKRITDKIQDMSIDPDDPALDIEKMEGSNQRSVSIKSW